MASACILESASGANRGYGLAPRDWWLRLSEPKGIGRWTEIRERGCEGFMSRVVMCGIVRLERMVVCRGAYKVTVDWWATKRV